MCWRYLCGCDTRCGPVQCPGPLRDQSSCARCRTRSLGKWLKLSQSVPTVYELMSANKPAARGATAASASTSVGGTAIGQARVSSTSAAHATSSSFGHIVGFDGIPIPSSNTSRQPDRYGGLSPEHTPQTRLARSTTAHSALADGGSSLVASLSTQHLNQHYQRTASHGTLPQIESPVQKAAPQFTGHHQFLVADSIIQRGGGTANIGGSNGNNGGNSGGSSVDASPKQLPANAASPLLLAAQQSTINDSKVAPQPVPVAGSGRMGIPVKRHLHYQATQSPSAAALSRSLPKSPLRHGSVLDESGIPALGLTTVQSSRVVR